MKIVKPFLWFILITGILFSHLAYSRHRVLDDAFITYRFSRNIAEGEGIVWNTGGEPTEGYTNFLLVLLLVPFVKIGLSPLWITRIFSFIALVLMAQLSISIIDNFTQRKYFKPASACLILTNAFLAYHAMLGLETILFTALLLWQVFLFIKVLRPEGSFFDLVLFIFAGYSAGLMRPEGFAVTLVLITLALFHDLFFQEKKFTVKLLCSLLCFLFLFVSYFLWKYFYFGDIFPNSAYIKCSGLNLFGFQYVGSFCLFIFPLLVLSFWGFFKRYRQTSYSVIFLTYFFFTLGYVFIEPLMGTGWRFLIPSLSLFLIFSLIGLDHVFHAHSKQQWAKILVMLILYFLCVEGFSLWYIHTRNYRDPRSKIGRLLSCASYPERRLIVLEDQGKIPYYSGWNTIDIAGLTTNIIAHDPDFVGDTSVRYCLEKDPDIIAIGTISPHFSYQSINRDGHGRAKKFNQALLKNIYFRETYNYAGTYFCNHFYSLNLFVRNGSIDARNIISLLLKNADFDLSSQYLTFLQNLSVRSSSISRCRY